MTWTKILETHGGSPFNPNIVFFASYQGMHMVSQPNQAQQQQMGHPQQPQQQHFMPAADGQQQRMMVSQPRAVVGGGQGMKIIPTSQQQAMISQGPNVNIQTVVRSNMSQSQMPANQPQQQQVGSENSEFYDVYTTNFSYLLVDHLMST